MGHPREASQRKRCVGPPSGPPGIEMGWSPAYPGPFEHFQADQPVTLSSAVQPVQTGWQCEIWLETEGEGFEPSMDEKTPITVFETAAFNRSATPPGDGGQG
jgi:hypothetical protein